MVWPRGEIPLQDKKLDGSACFGTPFAHSVESPSRRRSCRPYFELSGVIVMKQICYLCWIAGMATLVAYGWSDNLLNQVNDVVQLMGELVAFMTT